MAYTNSYGYRDLVGRNVKINRGGPDSVEGVLLGIQSDYLIAIAKDGVVYVNAQHIKSVTDTGKSGGVRENVVQPLTAHSFHEVMQALRLRFVKVNRGGPEKLEGILVDVNQGYLIMTVKGQEVVHIPISHIKSITVALSGNQSKGNQSGGNRTGGNKSEGNRTGGNQTGGNRTGGHKSGGHRTGGNQTGGNRTGGHKSGGHRTGGNQTGGNRSKNRSQSRSKHRSSNKHRSNAKHRSGNHSKTWR